MFDLQVFIDSPSIEKLEMCKKDELYAIAVYYKIENIVVGLKKDVMKSVIKDYFTANGFIINPNNTEEVESKDKNNGSDVVESNLSGEGRRTPTFLDVPEDSECISRYKIDAMVDLERDKLKMQIQIRHLEIEIERQKLQMEHELKVKELEILGKNKAQPDCNCTKKSETFDINSCLKLIPTFNEASVDNFFLHFEKIAFTLQWPQQCWSLLIQSALQGKAQEVYNELSIEQSSDYSVVKKLILQAYELVPEAYRQEFRSSRKVEAQTYIEFARYKRSLFEKWCNSSEVGTDFIKLKDLILLEEFKLCVSREIRQFLNERVVGDIDKAAVLAEEYCLNHKEDFNRQSMSKTSENRPNWNRGDVCNMRAHGDTDNSSKRLVRNNVCFYCKGSDHFIAKCPKLTSKHHYEESSRKPTCYIHSKGEKKNESKDFATVKPDIMMSYEPFLSDGTISLLDMGDNTVPIKILRDTGCSQSLVLADTLHFSSDSYSGESVIIQGIQSQPVKIPLHRVVLNSPIVSGVMLVGVVDSIPCQGIHLLLGNDLAGGKVIPSPIIVDEPLQNYQYYNNECKKYFPSCVITRAQRKKSFSDNADEESNIPVNFDESSDSDYDISNSFIGDMLNEEINGKEIQILPDKEISSRNFAELQRKDSSLVSCFDKIVIDPNETPICYFIQNDVLMRKYRPPEFAMDEEWAFKYQVVVPKLYRSDILKLAHDTVMSAHLGVKKTYHKVLNHFFWPGLHSDVVKYCRSCLTCQTVGKPNIVIPKAPLIPIPAVEEPFSKIVIDCVGPLPKTKSGNEYILTIMCTSTRFPEAIPLRNIKAKSVVRALNKFFCFVGLPKYIQSDQGSNFASNLFRQVTQELGIQQIFSSAYHPESQGVLERFHQTLKSMIRSYCFDSGKDWDEGLHFLLFAARDSIQSSLGFSPFELIFGHNVRGPLKLLQEKLINNSPSMNILQYVSNFREKLATAFECAQSNLRYSQERMKSWYDSKTRDRCFQVGDKVLALLPVVGNALQARYSGPYVIEKRVGQVNYIIKTPDRRKPKQMCHVNMLKKFIDRRVKSDQQEVKVNPSLVVSKNGDGDSGSLVSGEFSVYKDSGLDSNKLENSFILQNLDQKLGHLPLEQREPLKRLIESYPGLFSNVPTRTSIVCHDIELSDSTPIKQHPYRINPVKRSILEGEIKYLLEQGLIEPSKSEWSSPCVLVPKSDKTYRFCTDYRKLNSVTKADSYPIPRIDDCIDKIGHAKYITKFDLLKGFWQVPLTPRAKELSAFITPFGFFQYNVMPFGMKNSSATFQRLVNLIIHGLEGCEAYIDDVVIYHDSWEKHLETISRFLQRISEANLTINLTKSEFCTAEVLYLGFLVGKGFVKANEAKVESIINYPAPKDKKETMRFLGMVGYYRRFCRNFSIIAEPLTNLLKNDSKFVWSDQCNTSFLKLKSLLLKEPVLRAPDFYKPFKLMVDACDIGAGGVLLQTDSSNIDHPVAYFSKKFNRHQRKYSTIEKECLGLILSIQHFEVYLHSPDSPVIIYCDHNPLTFINRMKNKNQRILRWSLLLQDFNIEIKHIKGVDNVLADALSRA